MDNIVSRIIGQGYTCIGVIMEKERPLPALKKLKAKYGHDNWIHALSGPYNDVIAASEQYRKKLGKKIIMKDMCPPVKEASLWLAPTSKIPKV